MSSPDIYSIETKSIDGKPVNLSEFKGKVLLVVNVASQCGFTPQYAGLEKLYEKYRGQGLEILGFPCNQFGKQEPGNENEIKQFCESKFDVKFPLFSKVDVNGPKTHPLYHLLKTQKRGFLGSSAIKWNFTKFLVDREGNVLKRFAPLVKPAALESSITEALK